MVSFIASYFSSLPGHMKKAFWPLALFHNRNFHDAADSIINAVQRKIRCQSTLAESCQCRREILGHWLHGREKVRAAWVLIVQG